MASRTSSPRSGDSEWFIPPALGHAAQQRLGEGQRGRCRDLRLLIAYAREFTEPRPYRLDDLARAAGMSISGVRTAYDDDEVRQVAAITGLQPRPRSRP